MDVLEWVKSKWYLKPTKAQRHPRLKSLHNLTSLVSPQHILQIAKERMDTSLGQVVYQRSASACKIPRNFLEKNFFFEFCT